MYAFDCIFSLTSDCSLLCILLYESWENVEHIVSQNRAHRRSSARRCMKLVSDLDVRKRTLKFYSYYIYTLRYWLELLFWFELQLRDLNLTSLKVKRPCKYICLFYILLCAYEYVMISSYLYVEPAFELFHNRIIFILQWRFFCKWIWFV